ncbi:MAG: hypothetical protein OEU26_32355 [Candidatus Tectomicrobia bacterium]|nr:hypothetical protein [Candidatus Tectomicrobia bacterium]
MQNFTEPELGQMTIAQIAAAYNRLVPADKAVGKFRDKNVAKKRYLEALAEANTMTLPLDVPMSDNPAAFVKAAHAQLDAWLAKRGYLEPRGGRGRQQIKGLTVRLRQLFHDVGVTITEAELKAEFAGYEWRDVLRLSSREKSDQRKGIQGPVRIERVGDAFKRTG